MLGRLFRQNSSQSLNLENQPLPSHQSQNNGSNINSYEDSYTREILYGISDKSILNPYDLNSKFFRILVCQDGGSLRSKQVLFDSSHNEKSPSGLPMTNKHPNVSRNILTSKIYHNINELHDYMFGCGLPTNELQQITKIHALPVVNNQTYGTYKSLLITKLFLISDTQEVSKNEFDVNWNPKPTIPVKDSKIPLASYASSSSKNNVTGRFAIGVIIPIESDNITDVISNNWHEISHFLIILQKTISKKLTSLLTSPTNPDQNGFYIINKRIQFPSYILANDMDLQANLIKLIKLINYNSNIPKLINSNSLMRLCVNANSDTNRHPKYHPMVLNWVLEILNWLEFKETNEHSQFLSSLLALIIPLRHLLTEKPFSHNYNSDSKEITRIVIMTGNPMVAKKLIFILNGFIPDNDVYELLHQGDDSKDVDTDTSTELSNDTENETAIEEDLDLEAVGGQKLKHQNFLEHKNYSIDTDEDEDNDNDSLAYSSRTPANIKPIPIKGGQSDYSTPENSLSNNSVKGWEIPGKATPIASTSVSNPSNSFVNSIGPTGNIPINHKPVHRQSLSKSSSMAYLSSSLNSSLSSSASNYSLSKLGGSFIEKWRNSFNSSIGSDVDYHHGKNASPHGNLNRRFSLQALRSSSPALEVEGFNLSQNNSTNQSPSSTMNYSPSPQAMHMNSPNMNPNNKLSKTQSMFDLYNSSIAQTSYNSKLMGKAINRSKASIYEDADFKKNSEIIDQKVSSIMDENVDLVNEGNTLKIDEYDHTESLRKYEDLSPNVAFTDEFRPEFILQSCPMNPRLEQQVTSSMKNDLLFSQNNCEIENIVTRTVFINLRAREIKLIEMKIGDSNSTSVNSSFVSTPQPSGSPISSYFQAHHSPSYTNLTVNSTFQNKSTSPLTSQGSKNPLEHITEGSNATFPFRKSHNSYKTTIKKVYGPNKQSGDKMLISLIEKSLQDINDLFVTNYKDINNAFINNDFNAKLSQLVSNLLN